MEPLLIQALFFQLLPLLTGRGQQRRPGPLLHALLPFQQPQGREAPCQSLPLAYQGCQGCHRLFHRRRVFHRVGLLLRQPVKQCVQGRQQPPPASFVSAYRTDHRHAQLPFQGLQVNMYSPALRFVQQVHAQQHRLSCLHHLQQQLHVPFQTASVTDQQHRVRTAVTDEIPGQLLLRRGRRQGIGPGHIHQHIAPLFAAAVAPGVADGLARPVAGVLLHAGEIIEYGAFAHVGVSRQGDDLIPRPGPLNMQRLPPGASPGGFQRQSHGSSFQAGKP